ncbi:class IV lanthionine synthetase LanL [Micromonospora okii]|uniref:class IV lanthionine synthetase LanL n=1 Tax=Micromonospora okii TaxID=1182970 RepID=UPI001E4E8F20|nr:class IV lanthionine synthetase LanL [Micromonospora okii]
MTTEPKPTAEGGPVRRSAGQADSGERVDPAGAGAVDARQARWAALPEPAALVTDLLARIVRAGWTAHPRDRWTLVTPPVPSGRMQGWKLHVSATVVSAPQVLAACAPILVETGTAFKFVATVPMLADLNELRAAPGGAGKFVTAYPATDELFRELVERLDEATAGLPGPAILSDQPYRPGGLVHYRYGEFDGVTVLGHDGNHRRCVLDPDGNPVEDVRDGTFRPPSWAPPPFGPVGDAGDDAGEDPGEQAGAAEVTIDGRYVVTAALQHANKGGVYEARDLRTGVDVVLKEARPHVATDALGRDARDVLAHEARLLRHLAPLGVVPRLHDEFVQEGHRFLVEELLPGRSLRDGVDGSLDDRSTGLGYHALLRVLERLARLVRDVHAAGVVIRDLSPNNVMLLPDGELRLIDLELAALRGPEPGGWSYLGVGGGTVGVSAPEQLDCAPPDPRADLFSLGAVALHLVGRMNPDLLPDVPATRSYGQRVAAVLEPPFAPRPVPEPLRRIVTGLLRTEPAERIGLDEVLTLCAAGLDGPDRDLWATPSSAEATAGLARFPERHRRELVDGIVRWLAGSPASPAVRPWAETAFGRRIEPCTVQHGVAGTVAVLARLLELPAAQGAPRRAAPEQNAPDPGARRQAAQEQAAPQHDASQVAARLLDDLLDRLLRHLDGGVHRLPGMHFGFAGTAWALCDAGRVLRRPHLVERAVELALRLPVVWPSPDLTHGVAGLGTCLLHLWEQTGRPELRDRVAAAAEHLLATVDDGEAMLWTVDPGFDSDLAGYRSYGFAHGTAGIGAFLLAAGHRLGRPELTAAAERCGDTLLAAARYDADAAFWPSTPTSGDARTHWCNGSSGVGTFLCRLYARTGDARHRDAALAAARAVMRTRWAAGTAYCHGLAGDGDFLLDLARATGDARYARWAEALAGRLWAMRVHRDGVPLLPDESNHAVTGGYGAGLTGHLAFLLRLRHGGPRLFHPDPEVARDEPAPARPAGTRVEEAACR